MVRITSLQSPRCMGVKCWEGQRFDVVLFLQVGAMMGTSPLTGKFIWLLPCCKYNSHVALGFWQGLTERLAVQCSLRAQPVSGKVVARASQPSLCPSASSFPSSLPRCLVSASTSVQNLAFLALCVAEVELCLSTSGCF